MSTNSSHFYNKQQEKLKMQVKSIKKHAVTKWNSLFTMLESISYLKPALSLAFNELDRADIPFFSIPRLDCTKKYNKSLITFSKSNQRDIKSYICHNISNYSTCRIPARKVGKFD